MSNERLTVTAHSQSDGSITSFVVQPESEMKAMLVPEAGVEHVDVADHGVVEPVDPEQLERLRVEYRVEATPAKGILVRREDEAAE